MPVLPDYSLKYFSFSVIICNECYTTRVFTFDMPKEKSSKRAMRPFVYGCETPVMKLNFIRE
jgi:hypothetical protein